MLHEVESLLKDTSKGLVKEARKGQLAMAERVARTIRDGGVTFVEAPVGTGKSLAYLVPSALSVGRTVISTAKKSLQDQLIETDIPAVSRATKSSFKFTVLKGASNYYCTARSNEVKSPSARLELSMWENDLEFTLSNGDVATFPGGQPDYWHEVNVSDCDGRQCPYFGTCGYQKALKDAGDAKLVVTNHHVVAHAFVRGTTVLGEYRNLVLDEAHQFEDALRGALSHQINQGSFKALEHKMTGAGLVRSKAEVQAAVQRLFQKLRSVSGELPPDLVVDEAVVLGAYCANVAKTADNNLKVLPAGDNVRRRALMGVSNLANRMSRALLTIADPERSTNVITHVTQPDWRSPDREIAVEPIEVGAAAVAPMNAIRSVVVTSGTLAVEGSFQRVAQSCGLPPPGGPAADPTTPGHLSSTSLIVGTPFDYQKQAVLYTPTHIPTPVAQKGPAREAWLDAVSAEIKRLVEASDGNTFVLFSSGADQTEVHRRLLELGLRLPLIVQKQGGAAEAERAYRATKNAVLLGLRSFFEGVNVTGDKLWQVIIPKLPFPVPTDPVIKARTGKLVEWYIEKGFEQRAAEVNAFKTISVPVMLVDLRQAVGRLIRTSTDVGVCAILDPRVWTGSGSRAPKAGQSTYQGYGATIVSEIGYPRRTSKFENIQAYYASLKKR